MRTLILAAAVLLASGCSPLFDVDSDQTTLEQKRAEWRQLGMHSYEFVHQMSCFCAPETIQPVRIRVIDDSVRSVTAVQTGQPVNFPGAFRTIDAIYEMLIQRTKVKDAWVDVQYDEKLPYPKRAESDIRYAADAGFLLQISDVKALTN